MTKCPPIESKPARTPHRAMLAVLVALVAVSCAPQGDPLDGAPPTDVEARQAGALDKSNGVYRVARRAPRATRGGGFAVPPELRTETPIAGAEAGFVELAAAPYTLAGKTATTTKARMYYAFQAAEDASAKPLFVFFNGGPGVATTAGLAGENTGRHRVIDGAAPGAGVVADNPASWSTLGSLLYIDERQLGFSYGLGAAAAAAQGDELSPNDFNAFVDGADFLRVILHFLAAHPALRTAPVVLVGESYGGTRATVMLHLVREALGAPGPGAGLYRDEALASAIAAQQDLFAAAGQKGRQFGAQVLIQPYMLGPAQDDLATHLLYAADSPLAAIAHGKGLSFPPCDVSRPWCIDPYTYAAQVLDRDPYNLGQPDGWTDAIMQRNANVVTNARGFLALFGVSPAAVAGLGPAARSDAWRGAASDALSVDGDLPSILGALAPGDGYFQSQQGEATDLIDTSPAAYNPFAAELFRRIFVRNLFDTKTFVTHAMLDTVCYSPAVLAALAQVPGVHVDASGGLALPGSRPGYIDVSIADTFWAGVPAGSARIRFPRYEQSGHMVSASQPAELRDDVARWLVDD